MANAMVKAESKVFMVRLPKEVAQVFMEVLKTSGVTASSFIRAAVIQSLGLDGPRLAITEGLIKDAANMADPSRARGAHLALIGEVLTQHMIARKGTLPLSDLDKISRLMMSLRGDPEKITRAQEQSQKHEIKETYLQALERERREAERVKPSGSDDDSDASDDGTSDSGDDDLDDVEGDSAGQALADVITPAIEEEIVVEGQGKRVGGSHSGPRGLGDVVEAGTREAIGGSKS